MNRRPRSTSDSSHFGRHPGEVLLNDVLSPLGLTPSRLAILLNVAPSRIGEIVNGRRGITAETALRLARLLGTSPQFWLQLQNDYELETANELWGSEIEQAVHPIKLPTGSSLLTDLQDKTAWKEGGEESGNAQSKDAGGQEEFASGGGSNGEERQETVNLNLSANKGTKPDKRTSQHNVMSQGESQDPADEAVLAELTAIQRKLFDYLADGPVYFDHLLELSGLNAGPLLAELTMLELSGLVMSLAGQRYARARRRK